jgi:signal peptidase II
MNADKNRKIKLYVIFVLAVAVLTVLDQLTKVWATSLKATEGIAVIPDVFEFYYLENTGTAWGMFAGARIMFLIITCLVVVIVALVVWKMPATGKYIPMYVCMTLLASGGVGNFIDRLVLGYVRDFLYFKLIDFPVFNVADSYVTVGLILLIILVFFVYDEKDFAFLPFMKEKDNEQ